MSPDPVLYHSCIYKLEQNYLGEILVKHHGIESLVLTIPPLTSVQVLSWNRRQEFYVPDPVEERSLRKAYTGQRRSQHKEGEQERSSSYHYEPGASTKSLISAGQDVTYASR
jgi:hypothetical protein